MKKTLPAPVELQMVLSVVFAHFFICERFLVVFSKKKFWVFRKFFCDISLMFLVRAIWARDRDFEVFSAH